RELLDIHASQDHVRSAFGAVDPAAVLAEVEASVVPAIGLDVSAEVPAAAAQGTGEDTPPGEPTHDGGHRAGEDMLLMAVDHVGPTDLVHEGGRQRIAPLAADVPSA